MKKLALLAFSLLSLLLPINVFAVADGGNCTVTAALPTGGCDTGLACQLTAASPNQTVCVKGNISITAPANVGFRTLGDFVSNALTISFAIAILVVLVMLIWGAFEWITSGGDKDTVGKARGRIINALIGLAVLAVAFALARVAGQFVGLNFNNITIPAPNPNATGF